MSDFKPVSIGLVGIGGYGAYYVRVLDVLRKEGLMRYAAAVVRTPGKYPEQEAMVRAGGDVPFYATMEEMLAKEKRNMEICAIPTGIESHCTQMVQAVNAGLDVVLEKPTTATIQELDEMAGALERTGRFCAIGFQSQYTPQVIALKKEICSGRLGKIKEVIVKGVWMRDNMYYSRNKWAGKMKNGDTWVLDGTINNPMAHYLFNGLYFAHTQWGQAAQPVSVRAELYHGHEIESEDTSCLEVACDNGVKLYFYGTLCGAKSLPITIDVIGEKGRATWNGDQVVKFYQGDREVGELKSPNPDNREELFRNAIRYQRGLDKELLCPLSLTRAHVLAVDGAFLSARKTVAVPKEAMQIGPGEKPGTINTVITDIEKMMDKAADERKLFSDIGVSWAVKTKPFSLKGFKKFEM